MQLLWLLPSLGFGAYLAASSGNYYLLGMSLASAVIATAVRLVNQRIPNQLSGEVTVDGDQVWVGNYRLPKRNFLWRKSWQDFVFDDYQNQLIHRQADRFEVLSHLILQNENSPLVLGVTTDDNRSQALVLDLERDGPHALIIGATGSGKSQLLQLAITKLIQVGRQSEIHLFDFKGGEALARFENSATSFNTDLDLEATEKALLSLQVEMTQREKSAEARTTRLLVIVDELAHLLEKCKSAPRVLHDIAARGRSLGMHLVIANQSLIGISRSLITNMKIRIVVGDADPIDVAQLGRAVKQLPLKQPNIGRAQLVSNSTAGLAFEYPFGGLPATKPKQEPRQQYRELHRREGLEVVRRAYSSQEPAHRLPGRPSAIRDLQLIARRAASRWSARR